MEAEEREGAEYLMRLRDELFREMEEAEQVLSRIRVQVERLESDLRIGKPEPAEYQTLKGREHPQAERRVIELFRELLKLEDRIIAQRARS